MSEYIEREAALDIVNGWRDQLIPTYGKNDEYVKCLETVAEHLESLIAADVRPVVLCKECKYRNTDKYGSWCLNDYEHNLKDDDFCSRGKRK